MKQGNTLLASTFVLLTILSPLGRAAETEDDLSCAVPSVETGPGTELAVLPDAFGNPQSLQELNASILRHASAMSELTAAGSEILGTLRGVRCETQRAVGDFLLICGQAFDRRREETVESYGKGQVHWRVFKETQAFLKLPSDSTMTCAAPAAPELERVPLVPSDGDALSKKAISKLAADTTRFNAALKRQQAALLAELPLQRGYNCHEVLAGFQRLQEAEREAFAARRDQGLAAIAARQVRWEPAKAP